MNCLVKQFAICLGVYVILLFNVMELCVVGGALFDRPCMVFHRMCVLGCGPSERLDAPSAYFVVCLYFGSYLLIRSLMRTDHMCLLFLYFFCG